MRRAKTPTWREDWNAHSADKTLDEKLTMLTAGMKFNLDMMKLGHYDFAMFQGQYDILKKLLKEKYAKKEKRKYGA